MRVALLIGGLSSERKVSLNTGKNMFKNLNKDKYTVILVKWIESNAFKVYKDNSLTEIKCVYSNINDLFLNEKFDLVMLGLHGVDGEDGAIQGYLKLINMPYTGSSMKSSLVGMDKYFSKLLMKERGVATAKYLYKDSYESINIFKDRVINKIGFPCIVKPNSSGSSIGMSKADNELELVMALKTATKEDSEVLVEEFIEGREFSVGVLDCGGRLEALSVIEIVTASKFFDYESKYSMLQTKEIVPAKINKDLESKIKDAAIQMHKLFKCRGYSRVDVLVRDDKVYVMEINTLPGFTEESLFPKMAKASGYGISEVLDYIIEATLESEKNAFTA